MSPKDSREQVPEEAVEAAGHVLETCEEERVKALLHARPGERSYPVDRRIDARKALDVAAPLITQPLSDRLKEVDHQLTRANEEIQKWEEATGRAEARAEEVERQREEWKTQLDGAGELLAHFKDERQALAERAEKAGAALAEREQQVKEAFQLVRGVKGLDTTRLTRLRELLTGAATEIQGAKYLTPKERERAEAEGAASGQCPFCEGGMDAIAGVHAKNCPLTQPSSNPPQQDREDGEKQRCYQVGLQRFYTKTPDPAWPPRHGQIWFDKQTGLAVGIGTVCRTELGDRVSGTIYRYESNGLLGEFELPLQEFRERHWLLGDDPEAVREEASLTQPEADPEVPRCEGSRVVGATSMVIDPDDYEARPCPGCPDCLKEEESWACDSCGRVAPLDAEGWEQTGPDDAGVTVERCPECRLHPPEPDCQPTPELLGEEFLDDFIRKFFMRWEELPPEDVRAGWERDLRAAFDSAQKATGNKYGDHLREAVAEHRAEPLSEQRIHARRHTASTQPPSPQEGSTDA